MGSRIIPLIGFVLLQMGCFSVRLTVAAVWETLPPDHWAYEEIGWLQAAGYLQELNPSDRPYTRGQLARALTTESKPQGRLGERFDLLLREFGDERDRADGWMGFAGGRSFIGADAAHGRDGRETGYAVLSAGVGNQRLGVYTALRADRDLSYNEFYSGKVWNEIAGLTEAAYFVITGAEQRWELKLGRDHRYWAPGEDHLLLNHSARGLDQISFRIHWRWGAFSALIGQLNDFEEPSGERVSRFLSGHRLDLIPWDWLRIGLCETLLFTGGVRLGSMNPLLPYYGELVNENSEGNGLIGLDFTAFPRDGFQIFGQLLLDDIQIEQKTPEDLEPPEWGWLVGASWTDRSGLVGAQLSYSGITNRTYNAIEPRYRYVNYGLPLGSALGNDGDLLHASVSYWPLAIVRLDCFWDYRRQGEGRVTAPFDTTYLDYTVEEGYSEPFPTGVVEKTHTLGLGFSTLPHAFVQAEGWIGYDWITDEAHLSGEDEKGMRGRVTLNVRLDHIISF